ncbi:MAG: DUF6476 family protein [Paracoccus sp. (in: a-proteobacteria)]|uniref:DUF6476 family protein n=1 Tax=Paracoccus sp. TaxID=267 RepID=UPI0026DF1C6C|nr:DUF6476 family protein [Paracoccus sp. (in: a-proteobacteria)]MDO5632955.1 DUF6476 family protein [Paracoccus sp. (in: a-proteobacteria)]
MADDHNDWRETAKAVPELGFLRMLVTALSVVMGLGMIAIVAILWLRLGGGAPLPELPAQIALPEGQTAAAVTFARDWIVVVTESGQVLLYDRAGALRDSVQP